MNEPLTKSQQSLRGKKLTDMSLDQLMDWIDACKMMEGVVKPAKARRTWKHSREKAEIEIFKRNSI